LRALLLQVLHSVRSERMLLTQLDYSLLFRWFVGNNMDDPIWDVTVLTKNRQLSACRRQRRRFFRSRPQAGMLAGLADLLACADSS
jgi:transposase